MARTISTEELFGSEAPKKTISTDELFGDVSGGSIKSIPLKKQDIFKDPVLFNKFVTEGQKLAQSYGFGSQDFPEKCCCQHISGPNHSPDHPVD